MSIFEIRANNYLTAIGMSSQRIDDFGYDDEDPKEVISRIYGSFVVWLTACEEARAHDRLNISQASFNEHVLLELPLHDDPSWPPYIRPIPETTLRQRAEGLWGVRIAMTHGDGDLTKITSQNNLQYARNAVKTLPGVSLENDHIYVSAGIAHYAVRTIVQIQDVLR